MKAGLPLYTYLLICSSFRLGLSQYLFRYLLAYSESICAVFSAIPDAATTVRAGSIRVSEFRARVLISSNPLLSTIMFRVGIVSSLRPITSPIVVQAARRPQVHSFRAFSNLRSNVLAALQKRSPTLSSSLFTNPSRTLLTDASSVVTRPSQAEAWKRYGITAVSTQFC